MKLLEPVSTGKTTFKNRIMFPPVATGYEGRCGSIGEQSFHFYKRLAEGGAGYIVIGDVAPVATFSQTPKLFREDQIPSFKRLADACHVHDCRLGIQLFYPEYNADALNALFAQGKMDEARAKLNHDLQFFADEITEEHMEQILGYMENCARLAFLAGVDCIGIHGGRLVGNLKSQDRLLRRKLPEPRPLRPEPGQTSAGGGPRHDARLQTPHHHGPAGRHIPRKERSRTPGSDRVRRTT